MGSIWTALGNRLETAWKRPTKPNSKRPKDGEIKHCENALSMGGLMAINAECWLDVLNAMPDTEIAEYVRTKYKPGLLNPFKGTSLYIKS